MHYARSHSDAQLSPGAASLLIELVGLEIGILISEVEKLAVYAGDTKQIDRADVARMTGGGPGGDRLEGARRRHDGPGEVGIGVA